MIPIRVRSISACRCTHECADCLRPICRSEHCVEVSWWAPGTIWSEYTCCRLAEQVRVGRIPKDRDAA